MSVTVANSRFITSSLRAAFYQQLVAVSDFHKLGKWLVAECEKAQALRQTERLKESSLILSGIPIQEYQIIGQFYEAYTSVGQNPHTLLENVVEKSKSYKSKALIALATLELGAGNCDSGINFCIEAIRRSHNVSTIVQAARSIAVIKSAEGLNRSALKDLEAIAPLAQYASPIARYQYLNSLAVEYGEIGRVEEASDICKVLLASPFAFAYPEWRETSDETALMGYKSRSAVSVIQPVRENVFKLPVAESSSNSIQEESAKVFSLLEWKKKMGKEPNGDNTEANQDLNKMSEKELLLEIIQLASQNGVGEHELRDILDHARKVIYGPKKS